MTAWLFQKLKKSTLHLLYPPYCLHCNADVEDGQHPLCRHCLLLMEIIDFSQRCIHCFSLVDQQDINLCQECIKEITPFNQVAAVFDYTGPAATLIKQFKYGNQPHLAVGLGAYMAAQYLNLDWPLPDAIIPIPISFTHLFVRGYNQSYLLADSLAQILQCPLEDILKRASGDYSQAGLNKKQRQKLDGSTIYSKTFKDLKGKKILLVDDVFTTGSTLRRCAEFLQNSQPEAIFALTVCKS